MILKLKNNQVYHVNLNISPQAFEFDLVPYPNVKAWFLRTKDALAPFGYEEINQTGANMMAGFLKNKTG